MVYRILPSDPGPQTATVEALARAVPDKQHQEYFPSGKPFILNKLPFGEGSVLLAHQEKNRIV
jgi:hypothetical protein